MWFSIVFDARCEKREIEAFWGPMLENETLRLLQVCSIPLFPQIHQHILYIYVRGKEVRWRRCFFEGISPNFAIILPTDQALSDVLCAESCGTTSIPTTRSVDNATGNPSFPPQLYPLRCRTKLPTGADILLWTWFLQGAGLRPFAGTD